VSSREDGLKVEGFRSSRVSNIGLSTSRNKFPHAFTVTTPTEPWCDWTTTHPFRRLLE
jgi:hypothetical protein